MRKRSESSLPVEVASDPALVVDEARRSNLYIFDKIGQSDVWTHANEQMYMIRHSVDRHDLLLLVLNDARHVLVNLDLVFSRDERLSSRNSKDEVNVNLCVGVSHECLLSRGSRYAART